MSSFWQHLVIWHGITKHSHSILITKINKPDYTMEQWSGIYLWGRLVGSLWEWPADLVLILQALK
jgi:hypothetical protein